MICLSRHLTIRSTVAQTVQTGPVILVSLLFLLFCLLSCPTTTTTQLVQFTYSLFINKITNPVTLTILSRSQFHPPHEFTHAQKSYFTSLLLPHPSSCLFNTPSSTLSPSTYVKCLRFLLSSSEGFPLMSNLPSDNALNFLS